MKELKISLDIYVEMSEDMTEDSAVTKITSLLEEQDGVAYQVYKTEEQEV